MKNQAWERFREIIEEDLPSLGENLILSDGNDYRVFGRYEILQQPQGFLVRKGNDSIGFFGQLRIALSWCVADKYSQGHLAENILQLEQRRQEASADLRVRAKIYEKLPVDRKDLIETKIERRRERLVDINNQLTRCVSLAKYWQIRGFNNETERIGRQASNRKNR